MKVVGLCLVFVVSGCGKKSDFQFDRQIGIADVKGDKNEACLAIANPSIKPGSKLILGNQPSGHSANEEPTIDTATVAELLPSDCDDNHLFSTELSVSGPTYYRIRTDKQWPVGGYVFAILQPSGAVAVNGRNIEGDLDEDGTKESFRFCLSSEGVHYQVWTGEPLTGKPRWHWYVYAGYDLESNCTEKEYFGPK